MAVNTILARQKWKRGTLAELTSADLTYQEGEPVWITDMEKYVIGDNATSFTGLQQYPFGQTVLTPSSDTVYTAADFLSGQVLMQITSGSGSDITITLPNPSTLKNTDKIHIVKKDSGTAMAALDITGGGNFNGITEVHLVQQYNNITLIPNGSNYLVVDANIFFKSGWSNKTNWVNQLDNIAHGLNLRLPLLDVRIYLSPTGSNNDSIEYAPLTNVYDSTTPANLNLVMTMQVENVDADNIQIQTGNFGVAISDSSGARVILGGATSYYYYVYVRAKFP